MPSLGANLRHIRRWPTPRQLFDIENLFRLSGSDERLAGRQSIIAPIVETFHHWSGIGALRQLPKAKLWGNQLHAQSLGLVRSFLESGWVPVDNNVAEPVLKYPILGRKAWLFVGNPNAGETATKLLTTAKTAIDCISIHSRTCRMLYAQFRRCADRVAVIVARPLVSRNPQHLLPNNASNEERAQHHERRKSAA